MFHFLFAAPAPHDLTLDPTAALEDEKGWEKEADDLVDWTNNLDHTDIDNDQLAKGHL